MSSRRHLVLALLGAAALACASLPAAASNHKTRDSFVQEQGGGCLPLKRIIRSVRQQFGGRVLDAGGGGGGVYMVRLLTADGQVLDIAVDCASGQVLGVRGG
jgi:uncharacterized membrane protein YkoI